MDDCFLPKKKKNKSKLLFVFLTLFLFLGISFGAVYFIYHKKDTRDNEINSALVTIDFKEGSEVVNITNTVPVIDDVGLKNSSYDFDVTNTSSVPIDVTIQLDIDTSVTTIKLGAVRYGLYVNDELVKKDNLSNLENGVLYTSKNVDVNGKISCKLVLWVDYYYTNSGENFVASVKATGESIDIIS